MSLRFRRNDEDESQDSSDDPFTDIAPGVPGRCPDCEGLGYIDHADLVHRTQVQHCRTCGHRWEYTFDAEGTLVAFRDLAEPGARPAEVRLIDVRDGAAPVVRDRARGDESARTAPVDDDTYDKSPADWIRDAARP